MIAIHWLAGEKRSAGEPPRPNARRQSAISSGFPYEMWWKRLGRQHQSCRVLARGAKNSVCLEFEDGFTTIISVNSIRVKR